MLSASCLLLFDTVKFRKYFLDMFSDVSIRRHCADMWEGDKRSCGASQGSYILLESVPGSSKLATYW